MSNELYQFTETAQDMLAGVADHEEREALLREVYTDVAPFQPTDDDLEQMYREQHARIYRDHYISTK